MGLDISWNLGLLREHDVIVTINEWVSHEVFSFGWWFLVICLIVPWVVWFKIVDRKGAPQILLAGLFALIITAYMDDLGSTLNLWQYPIKLLPIGLVAMPFDFSVIPVFYMIIYQYSNSWRNYSVALLILAVFSAYVGEPISEYLNLLFYVRWKYFYSFIFYIITGIIIKVLTDQTLKFARVQ